MRVHPGTLLAIVTIVGAVGAGSCAEPEPPPFTFYDEVIRPVLRSSCQQQTTGCHVVDGQGNVAGNIDLTSYDAVQRRRDALLAYGPYTTPLLLLKGGEGVTLRIETLAGFVEVPSDIRHAAGSTFDAGTEGYVTLKRWMETGAQRDGNPFAHHVDAHGDCKSGVPTADLGGYDPDASLPGFDTFTNEVRSVLRNRCSAGNCHGSASIDLRLTCGDTDAENHWNFFIARQYVAADPSRSELLQKPLAVLAGGTFHQGGDVFESTEDDDYLTLRRWAEDVGAPPPPAIAAEDGFRFFVNRVQPQLARKGCMFLNCHSIAMFNDMRLRGGSNGNFSPVTMESNYHFARRFLAIESNDPNDSRIVAKNLFPGEIRAGEIGDGIRHRGGSLLEDFQDDRGFIVPADASLCPPYPCAAPWDACPSVAEVDADGRPLEPAYCTIAEWHRIERQQAIDAGLLDAEPLTGVVWVSRPPNDDRWIEYDVFEGGSDLLYADATVGVDGAPALAAAGTSLLAACDLGASPDVRSPSVGLDGDVVYFSARATAADPLRIYSVGTDGTGCALVPGLAAESEESNGLMVHDTDPVQIHDGRILFASSRGLVDCGLNDAYCGATPSQTDLRPNLNLYVFDPGSGETRQMTYLLNQEMAPALMSDGRIILTSEKRAPEFYQLAGRRLNPDGGDYHPLVGQRARDRGDEDAPEVGGIGFEQLTDLTELADRNFAFILSNHDDLFGGGSLAVLNRSVGVDQPGRDGDGFYLHSIRIVDADGAPSLPSRSRATYRGPAALPTGWVLVSADPSVSPADLAAGSVDYGLFAVNPRSDERVPLVDDAGTWEIDAAPVYRRPYRTAFRSRQDEPNGGTSVSGDDSSAVVHFTDFPMLATILFANTREGRPIDSHVGGIGFFEDLPPPAGGGGETYDDAFGTMHLHREAIGDGVRLQDDGSVRVRVPGGRPIVLQVLDSDLGEIATQREATQFAPGERITQSFPRRLFNGMCAGCHGSITGREIEAAVNPDILTSASLTLAADEDVSEP